MREAVKAAGLTCIVDTFQTKIGCDDEPYYDRDEQYYGSGPWKRRYKRRILRAGITWRVGKSVAEGCMDWAPTASWMDVAQDREMWKRATDALLTNERYWREVA
jgi:hypothetical protein